VWDHELLWTTATAVSYWVCTTAALDERCGVGCGWAYVQTLLAVLISSWYLAVYGLYGVSPSLSCPRQLAGVFLWPILSLEKRAYTEG
jgi:hypothetical protein